MSIKNNIIIKSPNKIMNQKELVFEEKKKLPVILINKKGEYIID